MKALLALFTAARALIWMSLFLALWLWLALGARRYDAALGGALPGWTPLAGVPFLAGGAALMLACVFLFVRRGGGTPAPFDAPRAFVATGPYRHVRNPMYLALFALLIGLALARRSPAMLAFVLVPALCAHLFVLAYEEPALEAQFGESYRAYRRTVPRWWPRRGPVDAQRTSTGPATG